MRPSEIPLPPTGLFIDNAFVESVTGGTFATLNPATEEKIADVALADAADVDRAVKAARRAFDGGDWPRMAPRDRSDLLYKLAERIEAERLALAALETLDNGKPLWESEWVDLPNVVKVLRFYAGAALAIEGETLPVAPDAFCMTLREPMGVCGLIIPWNLPALMLAWKCGPALAAGNTVVLKPAEQTPLSALAIAKIAAEVGFPPGVFNVVNGPGEITGAALAAHPEVDKIAFTGSTATGRRILSASAASNLKRVSLELGGKSPVIIFPDADLEKAVEETLDGIYFNQGEICSAGSRVLVSTKIRSEFLERMCEKIQKRRVGDPFDPQTEQGALVSQEQLNRVERYVRSGQEQGARLVTGGYRIGDVGAFYAPTLFDNVRGDMIIAREEIFGPVLAVQDFTEETVDAVIAEANRSDYGLAATVFTRDMNRALYVAKRLRVGTIWLNCSQKFDPVAPFGGYKQSGFGRDLGRHALDEYTQIKTVWMSAQL